MIKKLPDILIFIKNFLKEKPFKLNKTEIDGRKNSAISERLIIKMEQPTHHIMTSNPTTYRSARSFYLVFYSPKFNNVYFKKGQWKTLDK